MQHESHPAVVGRNAVELWQLYVAPALHGSGVASQLMSAAMDHARTQLHDVVWLGLSEHNARGVAFYRSTASRRWAFTWSVPARMRIKTS